MKTLTEVLEKAIRNYPENVVYQFRNKQEEFETITYHEAGQIARKIGAGLVNLGVKSQTHIGLIADVSKEWNLADLAVQLIGAVDVPRGTDSTAEELGFIIDHSESKIVFVQDPEQIDKVNTGLKKHKLRVEKFIILNNEKPPKSNKSIMTLDDLIKIGDKELQKNEKMEKTLNELREKVKPESLATLVYTSGTTGNPKGVMLHHSNFASQLNILPSFLGVIPGSRGLTLLPPWHIFGRIAEYLFFTSGCRIIYSSVRTIGEDLKTTKPQYVPAVPRIWEGVYNKIVAGVRKSGKQGLFNFFKFFSVKLANAKSILSGKERLFVMRNPFLTPLLKLYALFTLILYFIPAKIGDILIFSKVRQATGGKMIFSLSGGGALPAYIDEFFSAIGINILEGYGLTETSPVLSARNSNSMVAGTVGELIDQTEIRLIDMEGKDVTDIPGAKGTLHVRGPQVMSGYYKNPEKTKEVLNDKGWFNTGDLVMLTTSGLLSIVGRSKDTIVLIGGENVEPTPIEEKLKESPYIDQVMCVGQDQKSIGALLVPSASEELEIYAKAKGIPTESKQELFETPEVISLYKKEIQRLINVESGFKSFERVTTFRLLEKSFEQGVELNNTLKIRRHIVTDIYQKTIEEMYS